MGASSKKLGRRATLRLDSQRLARHACAGPMGTSRYLPGAVAALALLFSARASAHDAATRPARGPTDQVRATIKAVSAVLTDPALQDPAKETARREAVRKIIRGAFAFEDMARKAMGPHWKELSEQERREFVPLFSTLFEYSYNRLVLRFLGDSRTIYRGEARNADHALVHTTLVRKGGDKLPVDYHLTSNGGRWAMSDVIVDGVSIAANYRAQFDKIIRTSSYAVLLEKMRAKVAAEQSR